MIAIQLASAAIVLLYFVVRLLRAEDKVRVLRRFVLIVIASWLAENTVIHAYGFYYYDPSWTIFVDQVPLMVLLIWPVVIDSAALLAHRLIGETSRAAPWLAAFIVLTDASLIEPIAVRAKLWYWTEPGLFYVPLIATLGWAIFAVASFHWFAIVDRKKLPTWFDGLLLIVAPVVSHLVLVAVWWIIFRWINVPVPEWGAVAFAWTISIGLAIYALRHRLRERVPVVELLVRIPAAGFFFVLLAMYGTGVPALVAYALAFAPPYLALLNTRR